MSDQYNVLDQGGAVISGVGEMCERIESLNKDAVQAFQKQDGTWLVFG